MPQQPLDSGAQLNSQKARRKAIVKCPRPNHAAGRPSHVGHTPHFRGGLDEEDPRRGHDAPERPNQNGGIAPSELIV